jgi:hypothetical protein
MTAPAAPPVVTLWGFDGVGPVHDLVGGAYRLPAGADWLHEVKHDGFGVLARKQGERIQIWSLRPRRNL